MSHRHHLKGRFTGPDRVVDKENGLHTHTGLEDTPMSSVAFSPGHTHSISTGEMSSGPIVEKPRLKKPSMRKAINEHCKDCSYDHFGKGNWRQQIQACTVKKCSLWPLRPVSESQKKTLKIQTLTLPC